MQKIKRLTWAVAVLVMGLAVAPAFAADGTALVKMLPPTTEIYVMIPRLQTLSDDYKLAEEKLHLEHRQDPLAKLKEEVGVTKGIDDNAAAAVAFTHLPIDDVAPGAKPDPKAKPTGLLFIPVTNYPTFLSNFPEAKPGNGGVTAIKLKGKTNYIKQSGSYAVIGEKQAEVDAYQPPAQDNGLTVQAGTLGAGVVSRSHAVVFVNLATFGPKLLPLMKKELAKARAQVMKNPDAATTQLAAPMFDAYTEVIEAVLTQGNSAVYGIELTADGFGLTGAQQFKPGTRLAQEFAHAPAAPVVFNRLPQRPYLFATSLNLTAVPIKQWLTDFAAKLPDSTYKTVFTDTAKVMQLAGDQVQQGFYAPNLGGGAPPSFNNSITVYPTNNAKQMLAAKKELVTKANGMKLANGASYTTSYHENVMQVGGFPVDQFSIKINFPPEELGKMGPLAMFVTQDLGGYAVATDHALVLASGADPVQLKDAIEAADGKAKGLEADAKLDAVRKHMMPSRFAESYLGVDTVLNLGQGLIGMFAPGKQLEVPANLPPIGFSASVQDGGLGERLFVPMDVMVTVKKNIDKFQSGGPGEAPTPGEAAEAPGAAAPADAAAEKLELIATDANFDAQVLHSEKPVLVDFWAVWCGPCRTQAPIVAKIAQKYQGKATVAKLDIDKNPKTAERYQVQAIPTLLVFNHGKIVEKFVGLTDQQQLEAALNKIVGAH